MFLLCLANLFNIGTLYPHTIYPKYMTRVWRLRFALSLVLCSYYCFYYARLAGIVDVTLDLLSICCCWHMKLLHKICRLRQRCRLHLRLHLHLLVLVAVVVIVDVASLLLFFLLVSIMCSTCYACRTPSLSLSPAPSPLPLLLVLIIVVALSLAFGFRRFSCNLPGKLLST